MVFTYALQDSICRSADFHQGGLSQYGGDLIKNFNKQFAENLFRQNNLFQVFEIIDNTTCMRTIFYIR